jgi:septum site-determining protein MinD
MRTISIVSGKGGVGKTTTAINLAAYLNALGQNVLLIDANINTPDVGLSLSAPVVPISLQHVLSGKNNPEEAIYVHKSGTKIMPSSLSLAADIKNLEKVTKKLKENFDFIIIDSAAGLGEDVLASIKAADECLIVTNPELPAITGAMKTIKLAEKMKKQILGILITRKTKNFSLKSVKAMLDYPVIGIIPEDNKVREALDEKETLLSHPRSNAAKGYEKMALKLLYAEDLEEKGFFEKIADKIKNFKVTVKFG